MLQLIIFITGGAILALELLASRILTPYFGVSLYIWSGILSITLVSLAIGYWAGGRLANSRQGSTHIQRLAFLFCIMPAVAAIAIVIACFAYPYLFYELARFDLVTGAFIACMVLLFIPLVATSAMNPLLVAILLHHPASRGNLADAGAGRVFFVSTIGSVAGVIVTAFGIIPHVSNFRATLLVAIVLSALPLAALASAPVKAARRRQIAITAGVAAVISVGALAASGTYVDRMWPVAFGRGNWSHEVSYRSMFGTVKILKSEASADGRFQRIYFQDGLVQNIADSDNRSTTMYTYALEALSLAYRPRLDSAIVLGIGAGMVPMRLVGHGVNVTTVDIDPASLRAASEIFGFDAGRVRAHQADARTFLRTCNRAHEIAVVDLFHGDGVPDYLITRDFFRDLRRCLKEGGIAVFNTFADLDHPRAYAHFLMTLRSELPYITLYRPTDTKSRHVNSFVVASDKPLPGPSSPDLKNVPAHIFETVSLMLRQPLSLDQRLLASGHIITDASNTMSKDTAEAQLVYRRNVVNNLPAAFLIN